jgi:hypothetical protein
VEGIKTRIGVVLALSVALLMAAGGTVDSHGYKRKAIEVIHPWTSQNAEVNGAAIIAMKIKNSSETPDRIIAAESSVAERVEMCGPDGATLRAGIALPSATAVNLKRGSQHLCMKGLKKSLTPYDTLPLVLTLEKAGKISVDIMVEEAAK